MKLLLNCILLFSAATGPVSLYNQASRLTKEQIIERKDSLISTLQNKISEQQSINSQLLDRNNVLGKIDTVAIFNRGRRVGYDENPCNFHMSTEDFDFVKNGEGYSYTIKKDSLITKSYKVKKSGRLYVPKIGVRE